MQIGIIGGGSAGMMAAVTAAGYGADVVIIEHTQRVGKKILSTGNGKCNFTNKNLSKDDYYTDHPSFVEQALNRFGVSETIAFFEESGLLAAEKRDGYFYPATGQAASVLNMFRLLLEKRKVKVHTEEDVVSAEKQNGKFYVRTKKQTYRFDRLILACGGKAAPSTGSDGSGYVLAKGFGHQMIKPLPVLTFLKSGEKELRELAGVRTQASLSLFIDGKQVQTENGELQLNRDALSGIPVFQLSHKAVRALDRKQRVSVSVNFVPQLSAEQLTEQLFRLRAAYGEMPVSEALCGLLHKKVLGAVLHRAQIPFARTMDELADRQLSRIAVTTQEFIFAITGFPSFDAAQATTGGVAVTQVDQNMMSALVDGLYFAGEILDVDGRCGGYNLQWAWTSGYIAGCHSALGEVKCYESVSVK
jgi:hypothetical protein